VSRRSAIRADLASRVAAVDVTNHKQVPTDGWQHARSVDLLRSGNAWEHLSYAVVMQDTRPAERQRGASNEAVTPAIVVFWYSVREAPSGGGFTDVDLITDLAEDVAKALAVAPSNPAYNVTIEGIGQPMAQTEGPITVLMTQIDLSILHELDLG